MFFEHLDLQWREIGHEGVDFNEMGSFRMRNIKRGLYLFASDIGKAPVQSDMKNIFESEVERFDEREIRKAIEWLRGHGFSSEEVDQNVVYRSFVKNAARPPDEQIGVFDVLDIEGKFHDVRSIEVKALPVIQLQHPAISPRLRVLQTSRPSIVTDRS